MKVVPVSRVPGPPSAEFVAALIDVGRRSLPLIADLKRVSVVVASQ